MKVKVEMTLPKSDGGETRELKEIFATQGVASTDSVRARPGQLAGLEVLEFVLAAPVLIPIARGFGAYLGGRGINAVAVRFNGVEVEINGANVDAIVERLEGVLRELSDNAN